jgi:alkylhydroperoxidase/carboxymuconolactone decarboxylase family protein YurZ
MPRRPLAGVIDGPPVDRHEKALTKLALADDAYFELLLARETSNVAESHLDRKTHALVRLGALVAIDATTPGYMWTIETARRHGATDDEIVGCLIAALPAIGVASVASAAPKLALALGFDVTAALEERGLASQD